MKKVLGDIGIIGIGTLFLVKAYSNVISAPDGFGAGENYASDVIWTIFFAVGGIALILYGIRKIKEAKQEKQANPST